MAKVLIIDDEPNWLQLCAEKLAELGYEVQTTTSCSDALRQLEADSPDVVVLDLRMPVSGRAMLQAMRQDWPDIPVIIHTNYSGYRDDPDLARTAAFAVKSPDLAGLVAAIRRVEEVCPRKEERREPGRIKECRKL